MNSFSYRTFTVQKPDNWVVFDIEGQEIADMNPNYPPQYIKMWIDGYECGVIAGEKRRAALICKALMIS